MQAVQALLQAFEDQDGNLRRFVIVPLVDNGFWVVVRIDRVHCKVIVADPRELMVRRRHPLVGQLVLTLKKALKRQWVVEALGVDILPRTEHQHLSAVLACLNMACWLVFTNKRQRDEQIYTEVFTYSVDSYFMQKARHFISHVIYQYGRHRIQLVADYLV